MKLVLATNNIHKIREIKDLLTGLQVEIMTKDAFPGFPDVEEIGSTLESNARLKAEEIFEFTRVPSLADDSGLEVDALGGAPGVMSARYAGEGCNFEDNNRKLLKALVGIPAEKRSARFRCVIALCVASGDTRIVEGTVEGRITTEIRGVEGFGYDPVFEIPHLGLTFAEMPAEQKNSMSHRGRALWKARDLISEYMSQL
jgi:XTP/dITP diphosphohydrolase